MPNRHQFGVTFKDIYLTDTIIFIYEVLKCIGGNDNIIIEQS
jgi:hypothetical protein